MQNYALAMLFFTILLDMIGVGILIPILPQLFANPASPHYLLDPNASPAHGYRLLGMLSATFSICQFFAAPIFGQLSDKIGRKRVLPWSIMGTGLGYVVLGNGILMRNIPIMFVARCLSGLCAGNMVVAQAAIGDISRPDNRARNFGFAMAAFGIGLILGPVLGGVLANPALAPWISAATPFWFAAFLSFLNVIFVIKAVPETHQQIKPSISIVFSQALHQIFHAWKFRRLRSLFVVNFLFIFGFVFCTSFAAVFLTYRFQYTEGDLGKYYAFVGLCLLITQGWLTHFVSKFASEEQVLKYTLWVPALFILTLLQIHDYHYLYVNALPYACSMGLSMANMTALISKRAGPARQGEALGLNSSITALAAIFPLLTSGFIAATYSPEAPLYIATGFIFLSAMYYWYSERQSPSSGHHQGLL